MVSLAYLQQLANGRLEKRRGGGGHGGGGGGGHSSGGGGGHSSSSGGGSKGSSSSSHAGEGSSSGGSKGSPPAYSPGGAPPPYAPYSSGGQAFGGSRSVPHTSIPGSTAASGPSILGGGAPRTIVGGAPFAGRQFGGGTRGQIYGGSGYGGAGRYAAGGAVAGLGAGAAFGYVGGLGFPYGYWPLYLGPHYYGDDEYGPYSNSSRPGGSLSVASLSPSSLPNATTSAPQYLLYGDAASLTAATTALQGNCSAVVVVNNTRVNDQGAYESNPTAQGNSSQALLPGYRSSSFALYSFFTDHVPSSNATANYTAPPSPPAAATFLYAPEQRNQTFEQCLNATIAGALPIEEGSYKAVSSSAAAGRAAQVEGRAVGLAALAALCVVGGARWQMVMLLVALLAVALQG
ncbi:hypothetical protein JCM10213v2_006209 [Rhodosporidiobolus nylandii]